jgi:hypothetical protein
VALEENGPALNILSPGNGHLLLYFVARRFAQMGTSESPEFF